VATGHALEGGVRVCGHVTGRASRCLTTVRGRACVDTWAGASAGDCFKTVVPVTVCDFGLRLGGARVNQGNTPDIAYSQGGQ